MFVKTSFSLVTSFQESVQRIISWSGSIEKIEQYFSKSKISSLLTGQGSIRSASEFFSTGKYSRVELERDYSLVPNANFRKKNNL